MAYVCHQCGANYESNTNCDGRFMLFLAKEFENPEYGTVHHLTVPCYYLQHNLYSKEGWLAAYRLLKQFISGELTPETARRVNQNDFSGRYKEFGITTGGKLDEADNIEWNMTIADVRFDTAEIYCRDIVNWAESIVKDSGQIVMGELAGQRA